MEWRQGGFLKWKILALQYSFKKLKVWCRYVNSYVQRFIPHTNQGFPGGSVVKNPPPSAGHPSSILRSERSSREGNGNPFQFSWLEYPMGKGAWWATVHGIAKESDMT